MMMTRPNVSASLEEMCSRDAALRWARSTRGHLSPVTGQIKQRQKKKNNCHLRMMDDPQASFFFLFFPTLSHGDAAISRLRQSGSTPGHVKASLLGCHFCQSVEEENTCRVVLNILLLFFGGIGGTKCRSTLAKSTRSDTGSCLGGLWPEAVNPGVALKPTSSHQRRATTNEPASHLCLCTHATPPLPTLALSPRWLSLHAGSSLHFHFLCILFGSLTCSHRGRTKALRCSVA